MRSPSASPRASLTIFCEKAGVRLAVHDLRHSFAVRSLEACGSGRRVAARHMVALSAWLGHASVTHTWWYHEGTEALLEQVARRTEAFHGEDAS